MGSQEDFSEEEAFELRPKGSKRGRPRGSTREESSRQRKEASVLGNDIGLGQSRRKGGKMARGAGLKANRKVTEPTYLKVLILLLC